MEENMNSQAEESAPAEWAEPLPRNCPPADAHEPHLTRFYRFVDTDPPSATDFRSFRAINPQKPIRGSECQERALSIIADKTEAFERVRRLPMQKGKLVASIVLPPESGLILSTGAKSRHHWSWWLRAGFDPVPICQIVPSESAGNGGDA